MRLLFRAALTILACAAISVGITFGLTYPDGAGRELRALVPHSIRTSAHLQKPQMGEPPANLKSFPDPNAPGTSARVYIDPFHFDNEVYGVTARFTERVRDERSIRELPDAIGGRTRRALVQLRALGQRLKLGSQPTPEGALEAIKLWWELAFVCMYDGDFDEATAWLKRAEELSRTLGVPSQIRGHMKALLGIVALRPGELANCVACVGPSSCIFPIAREAVHLNQEGSREAVKRFTAYLDEWPGDLRVLWLLNLAYMTLGECPEKVPPRYLIKLDRFRSRLDLGRFPNVVSLVGLAVRGPDLAGGSIFDDLDGDGRPDLFVTSFDGSHGASLFRNRGDGTFEDRSAEAGLEDQVYALNCARADYDNDGWPDVLLMRGGWEMPARLSLVRNKRGGAFEDVTIASGLGDLIATESAAWGDFDNDGLVDLFVCGEYLTADGEPDPRNRCRLYRNQGDGTFVDVAARAGVQNNRWAKGVAWGDYDNDGQLDLYLANMDSPGRLYHNEGNGTFRDVATEMGIRGLPCGFTCLFWDYDNDSRLDLLVSDYNAKLAHVVADFLGLPANTPSHPRLFHNLGAAGFRDVTRDVGLGQPIVAMSLNCGDIDNDGLLDLHFGTRWMSFSGLVPDLTFKNVGGRQFEDITFSSGTGHLQKGHGISFADYDDDGDLDFFVVLGRGYPGDRGYTALFQNPGHGRLWIKVKLVGTKTNRSALGAKIRVDLTDSDGGARSIHRVVGNNGSFGGNSLVEMIGLLDSRQVSALSVTWPTSRTRQTFHDLAADQSIEITEESQTFKVLHKSL